MIHAVAGCGKYGYETATFRSGTWGGFSCPETGQQAE
tara:strand:- start:588 stop:698 length:111 start_codon:yes stop_codon:yes gene_type:complete